MTGPATAVSADRARPTASTECGQVVMLIENTRPPDWAVQWCHRRGLEPGTRRTSTRPPHGSTTGLLRTVTDLAGHHVLVVRPSASETEPTTVTAAIGDLPTDAPVLAAAVDASAQFDTRLVLVHGVPPSFAERSVGLDAALNHGRWLLDAAAESARTQVPGLRVDRRLSRMRPHELVSEGLGVIDPSGLLVLGMPARPTDGGAGLVLSSALYFGPNAILFVPTDRDSYHRQPPTP